VIVNDRLEEYVVVPEEMMMRSRAKNGKNCEIFAYEFQNSGHF
jgi:hypothetical protein